MMCIFCKIINREIPASIIYENDSVVAIDDLHPQAPQHKLILPKQHIESPNHLGMEHSEVLGEIFTAAKNIAKDLQIAEDGYRLVLNCNSYGGQTVFHLHVHLLGGRPMHWPPG